MPTRAAFTNAKILRNGKLEEGAFAVEDGVFTEYIEGENALDLGGDTVIPGLVCVTC